MRRLARFEPDSAGPRDWRCGAILTATLFLNFAFCNEYGLSLWGFGPLQVDVCAVGCAVLLMTAMFYVGPALAVHASGRSTLELMKDSFGSVPAVELRLVCIGFLAMWIAKLIATLEGLMARDVSSWLQGAIAAGLLIFLILTGLQSTHTVTKLAWFTNKLGLAILVAAAFRVREGWPAIAAGLPIAGHYPAVPRFFDGTAGLS